ncbi:hypothetical protein RhiirC2_721709 [Rhizophagus irregularis]|uniref:Uncharacterized protein n=1 Tax=Rhizophagus irregularis TaxID=588596 RepID=A0A2N1M4V1_9GLOM|nr:hypothetical protein RhiirC2_721709 [Rhizophagus irregularis]
MPELIVLAFLHVKLKKMLELMILAFLHVKSKKMPKLSVLVFLYVKPKGNTPEPIIPALLHVKSKKNAKTISFSVFTCKIKRKNAETNSFGVLYKYKSKKRCENVFMIKLEPARAQLGLSQDFHGSAWLELS